MPLPGPPDDEQDLAELGLGGRLRVQRTIREGRPFAYSIGLHAIVLAAFAIHALQQGDSGPRHPLVKVTDSAIASAQGPLDAMAKRARLIREARRDRAEGRLRLGEFLIRANAIDAEEEGSSFDLEGALDAYRTRVAEMKRVLREGPAEEAVPRVFGDLTYTGTPGGRMGDTLLSRRGSCEPVSHLVAATLFDAGLRERARLRFYGGPLAGVTHLTPVLSVTREDGRVEEVDLMAGGPSVSGGAAFPASDLVDAYARAHRLAARPAGAVAASSRRGGAPSSGTGLVGAAGLPTTRTLTSGYPSNGDRFQGALPLFAERAIRSPAANDEGGGAARPEPPPCSFYVSLAWLDPPKAEVLGRGVDVELVRAPSLVELERLSTIILDAEAHPPSEDLAGRLLDGACLAALYDHAGLMFSLAADTHVAARAVASAQRERESGTRALAELAALPPERRREILRRLDQIAFGRSWVLMFLPGGEEAVESVANDSEIRFGRSMALASLIVAPRTRSRGIALADALPIGAQIDLMHELMHAHDNARPWAASYALDLSHDPEAKKTRFARTYDVFYALAWRLWEAARSPEETVEALAREAERAGLDKAERRAIAVYYKKHLARLYRTRDGGLGVIARASTALEAAGFAAREDVGDDDDISADDRAAFVGR